ncbi:hypothetical protein CPB84DRAFT_1798313 [Gymnopilus junonius]|uniref:Uncharacterized protein n=1 Tax=Gymnopilus junonius TaxID=109634 RepID=A0A9P5NBB1_GYMJU|nr:hypothetical protein CPB84DRAFT_1798313 [Gymnopilus junonius]
MTVLGDKRGSIRKDSIIISSDLHGSSKFDDNDLPLRSLSCDTSSRLLAFVPTSETGSSPEASAASSTKGKKVNDFKERWAKQQVTAASGRRANAVALVQEIDKERKAERHDWKKVIEDLQHDLEECEMSWETRMSARDRLWEAKMSDTMSACVKDWEAKMSDTMSARDRLWEAKMSDMMSACVKDCEAKMAKNNQDWDTWCKKMEATQKEEKETLTATCEKLVKENAKLTKDFADQVAWQAKVEADLGLLDAIVLRNLIDQAQELLAQMAGLPIDSNTRPSVAWRMHLATEMTDPERLNKAKSLFAQRHDEDATAAMQVLESEGGMLLIKRHSEIREEGDKAAHGPMSHVGVSPTVERQPHKKRGAIMSVITFVCGPESISPSEL